MHLQTEFETATYCHNSSAKVIKKGNHSMLQQWPLSCFITLVSMQSILMN